MYYIAFIDTLHLTLSLCVKGTTKNILFIYFVTFMRLRESVVVSTYHYLCAYTLTLSAESCTKYTFSFIFHIYRTL